MKKLFYLVLAVVLACSCHKALDATKSEFSVEEQSLASRQLIERVVGRKASRSFEVRTNPQQEDGKDWFA